MPPSLVGLRERIIPKAYETVEKAIDAGDGPLAMQYLKATDLAEGKAPTYQVAGDMHLSQTMALLPATPTEAAAKPPGSDMSLSIHPNFSQIQDAVLVPEDDPGAVWCEQSDPEDEEAQW